MEVKKTTRKFRYKFEKIVPKRPMTIFLSSLFKKRLPKPILKRMILLFSKVYGANLSESEKSLSEFTSMNDFIKRKLKKGARKVCKRKNIIVSPCDGYITQMGKIYNNILIQAKGIYYSLDDLLIENSKKYVDGWYISIYLPPGGYHRVHSPVDGIAQKIRLIRGEFNPLDEVFRMMHSNLYVKNQRTITKINYGKGNALLVMIGASVVGKIIMFDEYEFKWNTHSCIKKNINIPLKKGDEVGHFEFGSAVILLFERNSVQLDKLNIGDKIRMGQKIGVIL